MKCFNFNHKLNEWGLFFKSSRLVSKLYSQQQLFVSYVCKWKTMIISKLILWGSLESKITVYSSKSPENFYLDWRKCCKRISRRHTYIHTFSTLVPGLCVGLTTKLWCRSWKTYICWVINSTDVRSSFGGKIKGRLRGLQGKWAYLIDNKTRDIVIQLAATWIQYVEWFRI